MESSDDGDDDDFAVRIHYNCLINNTQAQYKPPHTQDDNDETAGGGGDEDAQNEASQRHDDDDDDDDCDEDLTTAFDEVNKDWEKPSSQSSAPPKSAPSLSSPLPNQNPGKSLPHKPVKRPRVLSSDEEEDVPPQAHQAVQGSHTHWQEQEAEEEEDHTWAPSDLRAR